MAILNKQELEQRLEKHKLEAEENDAKRRATLHKLPYINLVSVTTPTNLTALSIVSKEMAEKALLVPFAVFRNKLSIAVFDPDLEDTKNLLQELSKKYEVEVFVCSLSSLRHIWSYYEFIVMPGEEVSGEVELSEQSLNSIESKIKRISDIYDLLKNYQGPITSKILEIILAGALVTKSSDIHLEPGALSAVVRYRIDGVLHIIFDQFPPKRYASLVSRIKLLSNLKLNVHDQAQDGRFTIKLHDRDIEIRTSIIPSEYGETIVMRLLDPNALKVNLEELGWRSDDLEIVKKEISKPNGLILNTGPTGSGKTTTLYAFLKYLYNPEIKIITVEDPIEYHIPGITQTQVEEKAGYTFASGLRSILRQDPDIVLVGEIRDQETADIAINASLTGHIVFSTLHTNDAVGAVPRLLDLGAKPQILGPALSLVIAQRLVRVLCPYCKQEVSLSDEQKQKIQNFINNLPARVNKDSYRDFKVYQAKGCEKCAGIGYKGRTSIFELFVVNDVIEEAIYSNPNEIQLKKLAREQQIVWMQEDGVLKILKGITTWEEVESVTGPIEWLQ
ncbi:MAG: GspE/PulE family protein [Minisyncoccia bacterium]